MKRSRWCRARRERRAIRVLAEIERERAAEREQGWLCTMLVLAILFVIFVKIFS